MMYDIDASAAPDPSSTGTAAPQEPHVLVFLVRTANEEHKATHG